MTLAVSGFFIDPLQFSDDLQGIFLLRYTATNRRTKKPRANFHQPWAGTCCSANLQKSLRGRLLIEHLELLPDGFVEHPIPIDAATLPHRFCHLAVEMDDGAGAVS
ncbi:hypothetical protein [Caulifigura coniformis]|uniref:hypothetical protein n=1 Tax=Caulifigura coniformis TaxID=2527983 RepID=UPI00119D312C|nr:hypothetical protein [Caulifigura coniformis]